MCVCFCLHKIKKKVDNFLNLFVDPAASGRGPVDNLVGLEPESDLALGALHRVRAVDDVTASLNAEVTTNAARLAVLRVGLAQEDTAGLHGVQASPDHGDDGARGPVGDEARKERTGRQILVVLLQQFLGGLKLTKKKSRFVSFRFFFFC